MNLEYNVTKIVEQFKSQEIEDENFITVEHRENGITMWTAFIGKGEGNNEKISIKISPSGGVLEIKRMAGDAMFNAEILLKKDSFNKVLSNSQFIRLYKTQKSRLAVEL